MYTRIAFIGAGRICSTLTRALHATGADVVAVASRNIESARSIAAALPGCAATSADDAVAAAELVFLTVPDDAIAAVAEPLPWRPGQAVVHCSGATEVSALAAAVRRGALTGGFHPLQSFSSPDTALGLLAGSTVAIEAPRGLFEQLDELAGRLGMHPITIPPGARALYHGGASFAASFLLSMLEEAASIWHSFGVNEEAALRALLPVARGSLEAAVGRGLAGALTGPISRGDATVVERHLQALERLGPEHATFYRMFARRQLELARGTGRLDTGQLERMQRTIDAQYRAHTDEPAP